VLGNDMGIVLRSGRGGDVVKKSWAFIGFFVAPPSPQKVRDKAFVRLR